MTNSSFTAFISFYGWIGIAITLIGLLVSTHSMFYYLGYRRGGGEWRYKDLFAPRPTLPHPDAEIVEELRRKREEVITLRGEIVRIEKAHNLALKRCMERTTTAEAQKPARAKTAPKTTTTKVADKPTTPRTRQAKKPTA